MKTPMRRAIAIVLLTACSTAVYSNPRSDTCLDEASQAIANNTLPQAERILEKHLQHYSNDIDAQFMLARVLAWQQHYPQALTAFDTLISQQPKNSDYLLARARLHMWMKHDDLATQDLEIARKLSPDYLEVWQLLIRLMGRKPTPAFHDLLQQAQQRFPKIDWATDQQQDAVPNPASKARYQLAASVGHDNLDNNRANWNSAGVVLSGRTASGSGHIQIDSFERFSLRDWQIAGGIALPVNDVWRTAISASVSPTAKVIARNRIEVAATRKWHGGFALNGGMQYANFAVTDSRQLYLGAEYYWSLWRAAYTYRLIDVAGAGTGHNQRLQLSRNYSDNGSTVSMSYASGKDVEYDGTPTPPISNVSTVSLYGRHILQTAMAVSWSVFHHKQGNFYNRNGLVIGIQFDF